jgi:hypothetical protein
MISSRIPSVKDAYFQHKMLTKIHGQPAYASLQQTMTELKANSSSVPSTLGGGQHGHLGLLLSDARYTALAHEAFVTPVNPPAFAPPAVATAAQIEAARDVWSETKKTFQICQATEKALIAQLVEAIDPIYLRALLNRATGQYSTDIRALLVHLFTTYGKVTPQQVKAREMELYNLHYDISQPVDTVFNSIDDLAELADHGNSPMTPQQMIDLAYVIFSKQPILQHDLRLWNRRPVLARTWPLMMDYFRAAQSDLSSLPTAGDIYHQQPAHQANIAAMADLVAQRLLEEQTAYFAANPPTPEPAPPDHHGEVANSLQRRETDLQARESAMMLRMENMMKTMLTSNNNNSNNTRNPNRDRGGRQGRGRGSSGGRGNDTRSQTRQYCWSHGACAHNGSDCERQATGHQNDATFANMKGGSTKNCYWMT